MRTGLHVRLGPALSGLGLSLCCLLVGAGVGLATVALHQSWWFLVLAAVSCLAVLVALPRAWWSRPPFVLGFGLLVLRALLPRPEGDFLIADDPAGWALLGMTLALVVAGVATAPRPGSSSAARPEPHPAGPRPAVSSGRSRLD